MGQIGCKPWCNTCLFLNPHSHRPLLSPAAVGRNVSSARDPKVKLLPCETNPGPPVQHAPESEAGCWLAPQVNIKPHHKLSLVPGSRQPIEPILFPKLRICLADFPYTTLIYASETAHLGHLMRIKYGHLWGSACERILGFSRPAWVTTNTPKKLVCSLEALVTSS